MMGSDLKVSQSHDFVTVATFCNDVYMYQSNICVTKNMDHTKENVGQIKLLWAFGKVHKFVYRGKPRLLTCSLKKDISWILIKEDYCYIRHRSSILFSQQTVHNSSKSNFVGSF